MKQTKRTKVSLFTEFKLQNENWRSVCGILFLFVGFNQQL